MFDDNYRLVMTIAGRYINDYQLCEDVCQEVFTKLSNNMGNFAGKEPKDVRYWLLVVTKNTALDYRKLLKMDHIRMEPFSLEEKEISTLQEPLRQMMNRESRHEVMDALREHDPLGLEILIGIEIEGQNVKELAAQLDITPNNLRNRLYRIRKWLKHNFPREEGYF